MNISRRWLIVALSFLALFVGTGVRSSFGAFVIPWEESFSSTRGAVSLISFAGLVVLGLGMPIAGRMADRFGARRILIWSMVFIGVSLAASSLASSLWQMIILYGILASIGFSGTSPVTLSAGIMKWFKGRSGLALGISNSGIAVGQMALVPLSIFMIRVLEWQLTLLVFGLMFLVILAPVFWLLYRSEAVDSRIGADSGGASGGLGWTEDASSTRRSVERTSGNKQDSFLSLMQHPVTWMIGVPYFVCGFTDVGLFNTHFIPLAEGRGFSPQIIVAVITLNALANLVGVLYTGYLTDKLRLTSLLSAVYAIRGLSIAVLFFANGPAMLVLFGLMHGITTVATIAPTTALCARIYGPHRVGTVFGTMSLFHQFGAAMGSLIPGLLFDLTGGYKVALVLSVSMLVMGAIVTWLINEDRRGRQVRQEMQA